MALFNIRKVPNDGIVLSLIIDYGASNKIYDVPNANIVSFKTTKTAKNKSNSFSITLIGDLSIDLEYSILTSNKKVFVKYGWRDGETKDFIGTITSSDIKFQDMAMALGISGYMTENSVEDKKKRTCIWKAGTTFNKIMELILEAHNWYPGYIVAGTSLKEDLVQTDMTDTEFLTDVLSSEVETDDSNHVSDYSLWFTYSGSRVLMNYAPLSCIPPSDNVYVYDLNGTTNSRMISFEITNLGELAFNVGSTIKASMIDDATGAMIEESSDSDALALARTVDTLYGSRSVYHNSNSSRIEGYLPGVVNSSLRKYFNQMQKMAIQAQAEFLGDLSLECGSSISIVVMLQDGKVHYSSGSYVITELSDTIENTFTTSAKLIKTSSRIGEYVTTKSK